MVVCALNSFRKIIPAVCRLIRIFQQAIKNNYESEAHYVNRGINIIYRSPLVSRCALYVYTLGKHLKRNTRLPLYYKINLNRKLYWTPFLIQFSPYINLSLAFPYRYNCTIIKRLINIFINYSADSTMSWQIQIVAMTWSADVYHLHCE